MHLLDYGSSQISFIATLVSMFYAVKFIIVLAFSFLPFSVFYSIKNLFLSID